MEGSDGGSLPNRRPQKRPRTGEPPPPPPPPPLPPPPPPTEALDLGSPPQKQPEQEQQEPRLLGNFGVLVVNQGGKSKAWARNETKRTDLESHSVVLVLAQEHDQALLQGQPWDAGEWLHESLKSGIACRARKSSVESLRVVEAFELDHEKQSAVSAVATFAVEWKAELRRPPMNITNVHFHHKAAKKQSGFRRGFAEFFDRLAAALTTSASVLLVGDFNQALLVVETELARRSVHFELKNYTKWVDPASGQKEWDCIGLFLLKSPHDYDGFTVKAAKPQKHTWVPGAHWPLLTYFNGKSRRSSERLEARAANRWQRYLGSASSSSTRPH